MATNLFSWGRSIPSDFNAAVKKFPIDLQSVFGDVLNSIPESCCPVCAEEGIEASVEVIENGTYFLELRCTSCLRSTKVGALKFKEHGLCRQTLKGLVDDED